MSFPRIYRFRGGSWMLGQRTYMFGILNITPDSFSDGDSRHGDPAYQVERARELVVQGADGLDLGAESTRPGFVPISWEEEWQRLGPVLAAVKGAGLGVPISVDTTKYEVAERALDYGADIINDIWGFSREPRLANLAADAGAGAIVMFNRSGESDAMASLADMRQFFQQALTLAVERGLNPEGVLVDPGVGFAIQGDAIWHALTHLDAFSGLGAGILVGHSRKRFLGRLLDEPVPSQRDVGTAITAAMASLGGADVLRVHNPAIVRQGLAIAQQWRTARGQD
jgi:dihydropteroate synthase